MYHPEDIFNAMSTPRHGRRHSNVIPKTGLRHLNIKRVELIA